MHLLMPQWPMPANVRAACSTRYGGVSAAPYDSLNLGSHVGDHPDAVIKNRQRLAGVLGARPVFLNQIHGHQVVSLDRQTQDGLEADACITADAGIACTVMVADCLPVLLCLVDGSQVAAAHAGWRGLAGAQGHGVLEATVEAFGSVPSDRTLMAWLGPCIGPRAFEVGPEVRQAFMQTDAACHVCFEPLTTGKFLADLAGLARQRLARLGVSQIYGNDGSETWCTVGNPSQFFSYRRDQVQRGGSGRFAVSIWRVSD